MISSFFGKTKPINYIVLSIFLFFFYFADRFLGLGVSEMGNSIFLNLLTFATLLLMVFTINQIVRSEKITDFNSYAILFFVLLLIGFAETFANRSIIFANFFLLLAIWRLLAIKSIKNVKHKIFDASLLIGIASLFYDWALAFLPLVFLVINLYDRKAFKNWLVPFLALATVFILVFTALRISGSMGFLEEHYRFSIEPLTKFSLQKGINLKVFLYIILILLATFIVFLRMRKVGGGKLLSLRIVFLTLVLGLLIGVFAPGELFPLLFTFFPASIFMANYMEMIKKPKLKEMAFVLCIAASLMLFAFQLNW